jgi:hypothetical protein
MERRWQRKVRALRPSDLAEHHDEYLTEANGEW